MRLLAKRSNPAPRWRMSRVSAIAWAAGCLLAPGAAVAADMTARQVTELLFKAEPGVRSDLAAHDLATLDLSGLDFKRARLTGSNMYGVDLTGSNLAGADLSGVRLDRAVVIRADFSGANIKGSSLQRLSAFTDMRFDRAEAPKFRDANLSGSRLFGRLDGADFRGADLSFADLSPADRRGGDITLQPHVFLVKCDFTGANLEQANLTQAKLQFANLSGVNLRGARLTDADLTHANLAGADVAGVDFTGADLYGADFRRARGLNEALGLAQAINLDKALR